MFEYYQNGRKIAYEQLSQIEKDAFTLPDLRRILLAYNSGAISITDKVWEDDKTVG